MLDASVRALMRRGVGRGRADAGPSTEGSRPDDGGTSGQPLPNALSYSILCFGAFCHPKHRYPQKDLFVCALPRHAQCMCCSFGLRLFFCAHVRLWGLPKQLPNCRRLLFNGSRLLSNRRPLLLNRCQLAPNRPQSPPERVYRHSLPLLFGVGVWGPWEAP